MKALQSTSEALRFGGHNTFTLKSIWPKKAIDAVMADGNLFSNGDASITLGVGRNMVQSIQHWTLSASLVGRTGRQYHVTPLGEVLFGKNGIDPYFEHPATSWMVHRELAMGNRTGVWQWLFSRSTLSAFSVKDVLSNIQTDIRESDRKAPSVNTLQRDIECLLRCYCPSRTDEHTADCPLSDLDLISRSRNAEYMLARGPRPTLSPAILADTLCSYWDSKSSGAATISLEDCLYGAGSPGNIFRMDESSFCSALQQVEKLTKGEIALSETAGLLQVIRRHKKPPRDLWKHAYKEDL